jgi:hypothetical protein
MGATVAADFVAALWVIASGAGIYGIVFLSELFSIRSIRSIRHILNIRYIRTGDDEGN